MGTRQQRLQNGFTIIEVVLVLAIAGLIFLIVFVALPQLQAQRRDTQRRKDAGRMIGALDTYASNNDGTYPADQSTTDSFTSTYLSGNFKDPSTGGTYTVTYGTTAPAAIANITYMSGAKCSTNGALTTTGATGKQFAVSIKLERGLYCQGN